MPASVDMCALRQGHARTRRCALFVAMLIALVGQVPAEVVMTEVMIDPVISDNLGEYIEVFNTGPSSVDLDRWSVGNASGLDRIVPDSGGTILPPFRFALIFDPDYLDTTALYENIPPDLLTVTIESTTFGRYGLVNNRADTIRLVAPGGTEQTLLYDPDIIAPGISLEKIAIHDGDGPANWAPSAVLGGTPGLPNSVRILDRDLAIALVTVDPSTFTPPGQVDMLIVVENRGLHLVGGGTLSVFADVDGDSLYSAGDDLLATVAVPAMSSRTSADIHMSLPVDTPPVAPVLAAVEIDGTDDERPTDNAMVVPWTVGIPRGMIRITEIMAHPEPGEGQWVEIFNASTRFIPLVGCSLIASTRRAAIEEAAIGLDAGEYVVLAEHPDSMEIKYGPTVPAWGTAGSFPHLNRSDGALRLALLVDAIGAVVDSALYPVPRYGRSLELPMLALNGSDEDSWRDTWGEPKATPGMSAGTSSILPTEIEVTTTPYQPGGDVEIAIIVPMHSTQLTLSIYDRFGRQIRRLVDGTHHRPGRIHRWDGTDSRDRPVPTGVYVMLVEATSSETGESYRATRPVVIARTR
jgi:hypothetical protein